MARFLKSFTLIKEHQGILPFTMEFHDGLNVVVGENGSGKSTLLNLIITNHEDFKKFRTIDFESAQFRFLDTEKHNPRLKHDLSDSKNIGFYAGSHFWSHGETMLPLILATKEFEGEVIFIDEPESGISLTNQKKISYFLQASTHKNCQVIVTTHSYVIIKNVDTVFSMDKKEWIPSKNYLESLNIG